MYNKNGKIGLFKADNGGLFHLFRITFLFLLATIGFIRPVSAQTAEAAKTITLNVQNRPIKEVLTLIERQSDYIFVYYDNILDIHRKVTLKVTNQPISAVLKQLFAGTDNTWKLSGRQIVIGRSVTAAAATPGRSHASQASSGTRTTIRSSASRSASRPVRTSVQPPTSTANTCSTFIPTKYWNSAM